MKEVPFKSLVVKYLALNFLILSVVFLLIPMYPWWFFLGISGVLKIYQLSLQN